MASVVIVGMEELGERGDARGLVIVVKRGRAWLPTGLPATPAPFALTLGAADGPKELVWQR